MFSIELRKHNNRYFTYDVSGNIISVKYKDAIYYYVVNPTDPWAWAGLAGDTVDLLPFVSHVGEVTRAVKTIDKVADVVDTTHDIAKTANRVENVIDTSANGMCNHRYFRKLR